MDLFVGCQHALEHAAHIVVQFDIETAQALINANKLGAEPVKRALQLDRRRLAFHQPGLETARELLVLVTAKGLARLCAKPVAQVVHIDAQRFILARVLLFKPRHGFKEQMAAFMQNGGKIGLFEKLDQHLLIAKGDRAARIL